MLAVGETIVKLEGIGNRALRRFKCLECPQWVESGHSTVSKFRCPTAAQMCHADGEPEPFGTGSFSLSSREMRGIVTLGVTPRKRALITFDGPLSLRRTVAQGGKGNEVHNPPFAPPLKAAARRDGGIWLIEGCVALSPPLDFEGSALAWRAPSTPAQRATMRSMVEGPFRHAFGVPPPLQIQGRRPRPLPSSVTRACARAGRGSACGCGSPWG